jgi:hypothetical protein
MIFHNKRVLKIVHVRYQVHFGESLEPEAPFWLVKDRSVQCFVGSYYVFMTLAIFTLIVFAFGVPLGVLLFLRNIHDHKAIVLKHDDIQDEATNKLYFEHNRQCLRVEYDR